MSDYIIKRLGHLGDGIADGPLFAPRTLPGEVITASQQGDQLTDIRITTPSAHRVAPVCRHYKRCGGCALQHAADGFLIDWTLQTVTDALAGQDLTAPVTMAHVSPPRSRRRASFAARRTKQGALVGFHVRASDEIIAIPDCQLLHPDLMAALPFVEALTIRAASRKATLKVFVTTSLIGLDVVVTGGKAADPQLIQELASLTRDHNVARLTWEREVIALNTRPEQSFDGVIVVPPAGAFMQPTHDGEQALRRAVATCIEGASAVADLFAGCGTFALPLAHSAPVHAVEGDRSMIAALDEAYRRAQGLKPVTTECRDLFRNPLQASELTPFDAVVLDPPRAGARAQCEMLASAQVPRVAYVSCNPTTFARDARILYEGGYQLAKVNVFDQFRWSVHTELVGDFSVLC